MAQVFGILIAGIIIWRVFVRHQNKKQNERFKSDYFESSYSKHWRK
jgi:cytochrome b561